MVLALFTDMSNSEEKPPQKIPIFFIDSFCIPKLGRIGTTYFWIPKSFKQFIVKSDTIYYSFHKGFHYFCSKLCDYYTSYFSLRWNMPFDCILERKPLSIVLKDISVERFMYPIMLHRSWIHWLLLPCEIPSFFLWLVRTYSNQC